MLPTPRGALLLTPQVSQLLASFEPGYGSFNESEEEEQQDEKEETRDVQIARAGTNCGRRVIYSESESRPVSTKKTVASLFLGEGTAAEAMLFHLGVRNHAGSMFLWAMWCIGTLIGLLVVGRVLPMEFVWASFLMVPLPLVTISVLSVDLLREIYATVDVHVINILQIAMFVDGLHFCNFDQRRIFWFCFFPSMVSSGVVDAYPAKYRAFFAKYWFGAAIIILVIWNVLMAFQWEAFGSVDVHHHHHGWKNLAFTTHHIVDQFTLTGFFARHLWCSIAVPEAFVMIKADMVTGRLIVDEKGVTCHERLAVLA